MKDQILLQETDRCVKCGLCLPSCPTYRLSGDESDSPRGRISLIHGITADGLLLDGRVEEHLLGCLQCLNCQAVCPSSVNYEAIIDFGIGKLKRQPISRLIEILSQLSLKPWFVRLVGAFRNGFLFPLCLRSTKGRIKSTLELLPPSPDQSVNLVHSEHVNIENQLFLGCITRLTDQSVLSAFLDIVKQLEIPMHIPRGQDCCGALPRHTGNAPRAERLAKNNHSAFQQATTIISLASGCQGQIASTTGKRTLDGASFLLTQPWPRHLFLHPLEQTVALHTPCSMRHQPKSAQATLTLLKKIPALKIHPLTAGYGCCGSAGHHMISNPVTADALLEPILDEIAALSPDILLTSNTGCSLHLGRGLRQRGLNIELLHPIELLARQLAKIK